MDTDRHIYTETDRDIDRDGHRQTAYTETDAVQTNKDRHGQADIHRN